jgi:hypothetical protein
VRRAALVLILALAASAAPAAGSTIVYSCGEICAMHTDGSHRHRLTHDAKPGGPSYGAPQIARSGSLIAFLHTARRKPPAPWIADARGRHRRPLRTPGGNPGPETVNLRLRPDGREALYLYGETELGPLLRLCRVATARGARPRCGRTLAGTRRSWWSWGPGNTIVSTDNEERHDICVTSLNGRCTRVLVRVRAPHTFFLEPSLAPDGRTFAVAVDQADQQGTSRVALFDARSGRHVRDVTTGHWDTHPAWSPDGRSLVFTRDAVEAVGGDESSICIVRARGGPVRCPLRQALNIGPPTWGR